MRIRNIVSIFCLLSLSAFSQTIIQNSRSTQTPIRGIKIFSSSFDSATQVATLDFMNDSPSDITAWGYCIHTLNLKGDTVEHGGCREVDPLPVVIDDKVQEKLTGKSPSGTCSDCSVIHSGEHKMLTVDLSSVPVQRAEIQITLIIYADGKVETNGLNGKRIQHRIGAERQLALKKYQEVVEVGQGILAESSNSHPTIAMIEELKSRTAAEPGLAGPLYEFKRPEWRKTNKSEFIPKDERGYLQKFVTEQQMKAAEFLKHQVPEVNQ